VTNGSPNMLRVEAGGFRWHVAPGCQQLLFGPDGLRLDEWLRGGLAQVVKHGPHRTVYRVALPGLHVHLKHYRLADLRAWLRQLLRPAKARIEFERALAVAARQVPTIVPVALGERLRGGSLRDSFLITHSLENTESVSDFIEKTLPQCAAPRRVRLAHRLATALGQFVARLHDAGIVHQDLHAANLLVRVEPGDWPSLHLIDLHAVDVRRPLAWAASRGNLVMLNRWFVLRVSRTDRYRFWRAYCRARGEVRGCWLTGRRIPLHTWRRPEVSDLARDLEVRTWRSNLRFWDHRDQRCQERNRRYDIIRTAAMRGFAVHDVAKSALTKFLSDPDAPFQQPGTILLKASRSSNVAEFDLPIHDRPRPVIYKRFRITSRWDSWVALLRRTPTIRSWIFGHGLLERCLPTARPLAMFHRHRAGLACEGYLLTEKIIDAADLHQYLESLAALPAFERRRRLHHTIEQIARLIRDLHQRQIAHRDLKAGNILIAKERPWLIDLVGLSLHRRLPAQRRMQNLTRLHVSACQHSGLTRTDKLRFLATYLQWGLHGRAGWKTWWRTIETATRRKIERNRRRGRPLG
jgi:tRNA A-37 threonylcarbamoyl transferase component Bud32